MEKEEILLRAQKENNGKDLADLEAANKGTTIGFTVGGLTIIGVVITELIITGRFAYGVMAGLGIMVLVAFIYKYIKLRKKHELVMIIIYSLWFIGWTIAWILQLMGRI